MIKSCIYTSRKGVLVTTPLKRMEQLARRIVHYSIQYFQLAVVYNVVCTTYCTCYMYNKLLTELLALLGVVTLPVDTLRSSGVARDITLP